MITQALKAFPRRKTFRPANGCAGNLGAKLAFADVRWIVEEPSGKINMASPEFLVGAPPAKLQWQVHQFLRPLVNG